MKNNKIITALGIGGFFVLSIHCKAQVGNCVENYERALKLYNYGMADSTLTILKPCLTNKKELNKETGVDIFRLAALSSIISGDPENAEEFVKEMLKYQPDYKNNFREGDLMEFRMMVNKTVSQPSLRFGIIGGINTPVVKLQKKYSDYETSFGGNYSLNNTLGYQFGVAVEKTLAKKFSLEIEATIVQLFFDYSVAGPLAVEYQYNQKYQYVEIPIIFRYYLGNSNVKPYFQAGVSGRITLNNMEESAVYGRYWFTESSNSEKILTTFLTDFEQAGLVLGGGIACDMNKINLVLDFRYNYSFKSGSEISKFDDVGGYEDISTEEKFHYTDDINLISLNSIQISLGFYYNLKYKAY